MSPPRPFARQPFRPVGVKLRLRHLLEKTNFVELMDRQLPLVFMHVPKCAGISLRNSLIDAVASESALWGYDRCMFGEFPEFLTLGPSVRETVYLDRLPDGPFDFASGHISLTSLTSRFPKARMITVMREPRIRIISYFLHWRSSAEEELAQWGDYADKIRLSHGRLLDFLLLKPIANMIDNEFTRYLLWPHPDIPDDDFIDMRVRRKLFREAREKLHSFEFIDILENPGLEQNIAAWLESPFQLRKDHETIVREDLRIDLMDEFGPSTDERLRELTAVDSRLWAIYARKLKGVFGYSAWAEGLLANYKERVALLWRPGMSQRPALRRDSVLA